MKRKYLVWLAVVAIASFLLVASFRYLFPPEGDVLNPGPTTVAIFNQTAVPIVHAHLWTLDQVQDVPAIPSGNSAKLKIATVPGSIFHLEFGLSDHDWRHCGFSLSKSGTHVYIVVDPPGNCSDGLTWVLTRSYPEPLIPPNSTTIPRKPLPDAGLYLWDYYSAPITDGAPVRGSEAAALTVVESCDFAEPWSFEIADIAQQLLSAFPKDVRIAFLHNPGDRELSRLTHLAAMAADAQHRFWPMHDLLMGARGRLQRDDLIRFASQIGLDVRQFTADMDSPQLRAQLEQRRKAAPSESLFIGNFVCLPGVKNIEDYESSVRLPRVANIEDYKSIVRFALSRREVEHSSRPEHDKDSPGSPK